jgi:DNA-binding transcriptional LysR family regulator
MMEDIEGLRRMAVFAAVVEAQSFSDAARRLGVAKSAVSKQVAELEQSLGVRLMNRTTRRSSLTEAGERFYRSCVRILEEASRATADAQSLQSQPVGTLRLTGPTFFGTRYVVPQVSQFLETYPEINVDLFLTDRHVDMFEENIDLAVRIGRLADSSLVAKKLAPVRMLVAASPKLFEAYGRPTSLEAMAELPFITYTHSPAPNRIEARKGEETHTVRVGGRVKTNSGSAMIELLSAGHGLGMLPSFFIEGPIASGALESVLEDWEFQPGTSVFAVYPHRHHVQNKVRLFVDQLQRAFKPPPWRA